MRIECFLDRDQGLGIQIRGGHRGDRRRWRGQGRGECRRGWGWGRDGSRCVGLKGHQRHRRRGRRLGLACVGLGMTSGSVGTPRTVRGLQYLLLGGWRRLWGQGRGECRRGWNGRGWDWGVGLKGHQRHRRRGRRLGFTCVGLGMTSGSVGTPRTVQFSRFFPSRVCSIGG
jgi:hypothetical protein